MHIVVVTQYFWPENFRINDLVREWSKRGHQVTVLTGLPNYPEGEIFKEYRESPVDFSDYYGAEVLRVPILPRKKSGFQLTLNYLSFVVCGCVFGPSLLRGRGIDVIFVFEPSPATVGLPAIWLSKIKQVPVVFWALDLWPATLAAIGVLRSPRLLAVVGCVVRFIYNRCTLVLGQSREFLPNIAQYCDDKRKVRYFPSWAEDIFADYRPTPAPELAVWEGFTVLFAGNVGDAQDLPALLRAAYHLRDFAGVRWVIVGDGRKLSWLKAEISRLGLDKRIFPLGRFPIERMPSFYAHADALLVTLKNEPVFSMTIPGKIQSYLLAGIPILGMLDGEGARVIRHANAGITCAAGDALALAESVLSLASMPKSERIQLGVNGKAYAQQMFSKAKLIDQLDELLNEAVSIFKKNPGN